MPLAAPLLTGVVIYDYNPCSDQGATEHETDAAVPWIKAARKEFEKFPVDAQSICLTALTIAAEGGKADIAKPLQGLGPAVFEIALPHDGNAFRVVYAVQLGDDIWVIHAFQKKSTHGI